MRYEAKFIIMYAFAEYIFEQFPSERRGEFERTAIHCILDYQFPTVFTYGKRKLIYEPRLSNLNERF